MDNTCVCCGAVIPEGRMVCPICEKYGPEAAERSDLICGSTLFRPSALSW